MNNTNKTKVLKTTGVATFGEGVTGSTPTDCSRSCRGMMPNMPWSRHRCY